MLKSQRRAFRWPNNLCARLYINPDFVHVITGNVDMVNNNNLRRIFHKVFNFIESIYRNKAEILTIHIYIYQKPKILVVLVGDT